MNWKAIRKLLVSIVLAFPIFASPSLAAETIVGKWAVTKSDCEKPEEFVTISPMRIESDFMICQFASVKRTGNTVTWTGHCYDQGGGRRPEEPADDGIITAKLAAKKLTLYGLGFELGPLLRCK
jgi:hypothetical protein